MAENQLQGGMAVEDAADDQTQSRERRFEVPPPAERREGEVRHGVETAVGGFADRAWRDLRVDEDGLTQGSGRGEQVVVARVVQRGRAGAPVDHGSDEAETRRAFELGGGPPRVGHGQGRERPEPKTETRRASSPRSSGSARTAEVSSGRFQCSSIAITVISGLLARGRNGNGVNPDRCGAPSFA